MINIPIWLLVLLCVFAFVGLCVVLLLIYGIVISIITPTYEIENGDIEDETNQTTNQQD